MKVCPNNPEGHKLFYSDARVKQTWVVDGDGHWDHTMDECVAVYDKNITDLTCVECGADAVEASTLEPAPTHEEKWLEERAAEWRREQFRGYPLPPSEEMLEAWKKAFDALTAAGLQLAKHRDYEDRERVLDGTDVYIDGPKKHPQADIYLKHLSTTGYETSYRVCGVCFVLSPDWGLMNDGYICMPCAEAGGNLTDREINKFWYGEDPSK